MPDYAAFIGFLKQAGNHSPDQLAAHFGISIDDLSLQITQLMESDACIIEAAGMSYRLNRAIRLLDEQEVRNNLSPRSVSKIEQINILQSVDSTNGYLLDQPITVGRAHICLAEAQLAGRGRRGNNWQSAAYRNLMFSVSWGFSCWPETITALGLAVALTVAKRLNDNFGLNAKIKWPNDLLVADDKIGGILIDVAGQADGACKVVIGIGLNIHQPEQSDHDYRRQDLYSLGVRADRNSLAAQIISDLLEMLEQFDSNGFEPLAEQWNRLSSYAKRRVRVGDLMSDTGQIIEGDMQGVDIDGALLVQDDAGQTHRFTSSNVSVRLVA